MNKLNLLFWSSFCLILVSNCANKELKRCENLIWRNEGKAAAISGMKKDSFNKLEKLCSAFKVPVNKASFLEGYDLGLSVFCQKGRGYVFGTKGEKYQSTCEPRNEREFLSGYLRGRISFLEKKQEETSALARLAEDRVWRKEQDYIIESTQDLTQAEQELDLLDSYREEVKSLSLESKEIKLELIKLKKRREELNFKYD